MIDWIETLTANEKEAFLTFCKKHSSPIQMYLYARFMGFTGNIVECDEWQQATFKKRNLQQILEMEIDNMREDVEKLRQAIDMGLVKQDNGTARIAMLQKELRGAIKQIQDERYLTDKQGLILAGADRALREIVLIFRDDPIEGPLQDAVMAVWTKILAEES
jgi:DNA gyrase/topoisomerase IV subunit A